MKFELRTAKHFYPDKEDRDSMSKLGFTFMPSDYKEFSIEGNPEIEINSLEELLDFIHTYGRIVLNDNSIVIYNDYLE